VCDKDSSPVVSTSRHTRCLLLRVQPRNQNLRSQQQTLRCYFEEEEEEEIKHIAHERKNINSQ